MPEAVKAIISDIGGVVVRFNDKAYFSYLSEISGHSVSRVHSIVDRTVPDFELAKINLRQFERRIARSLGIGEGMVQWFEFYKRNVRINVDVTDLIEQLHNNYLTGYITNVDTSKYSLSSRLIGKEMFDYAIASCRVHLRKPDPRIYRLMLKRMGVRPGQAVFIDDRPENVRGARGVGINSILYKDRRQLDISLGKLL